MFNRFVDSSICYSSIVLIDVTINRYANDSATVKPEEDAGALDAWLSKCTRKSITKGSGHGAPKGASGPATHPRWPPLGVTINKQFGFSCHDNNIWKYTH